MVRRGGFGHFGAGGHEGVVEELTVIARVSHHVDDAHAFFFFLFFSPFVLFFRSCLVSWLLFVKSRGVVGCFEFGLQELFYILGNFFLSFRRALSIFGFWVKRKFGLVG